MLRRGPRQRPKKLEKEAKKAAKEKSAAAMPAAEEDETGKRKRGRKRKNASSEADSGGPKKVRICEQVVIQLAWTQDIEESVESERTAPVARMY